MREKERQITNLTDAINRLYVSWCLKMDDYVNDGSGKQEPCLGKMIEDRFNHLMGLAPDEAQKLEWMMAL